MSGNKHDNGVHEIGTPETLKAYQEDTPGQEVEKYLAGIQEVIQEKKEKQKKSFMQVFQNPLKGFPYNEELDDNFVKPLEEASRPNYKPVKKNHYDVVVRNIKKKDAYAIFNFTKDTSDRLDIEDIDADQITGSGMSSWSDGDMYIQGDDAGKVGLEVLKKFKSKGIKVLGESLEERYNKKADIYDDDYRNQVKYNLRQKMMRLKKEKGPNWNNDYKDAQKHHDAIVKIDKQVEKDRKEYEVLTKKNNQDEFLKYLGDEKINETY